MDVRRRRVALPHLRLDVVGVVAFRAQHGDRRLGGVARPAMGFEPVVDGSVGLADLGHDGGAQGGVQLAVDHRPRLGAERHPRGADGRYGGDGQDQSTQDRESLIGPVPM